MQIYKQHNPSPFVHIKTWDGQAHQCTRFRLALILCCKKNQNLPNIKQMICMHEQRLWRRFWNEFLKPIQFTLNWMLASLIFNMKVCQFQSGISCTHIFDSYYDSVLIGTLTSSIYNKKVIFSVVSWSCTHIFDLQFESFRVSVSYHQLAHESL